MKPVSGVQPRPQKLVGEQKRQPKKRNSLLLRKPVLHENIVSGEVLTHEEGLQTLVRSGTKILKGPDTNPEVTLYIAAPGSSSELVDSRSIEIFTKKPSSPSFPANLIEICSPAFAIKSMLTKRFKFDVKKACKRLRQHTWSNSAIKRELYKEAGFPTAESLRVICAILNDLIEMPSMCFAIMEKVEDDITFRSFNCLVPLAGVTDGNNQGIPAYFYGMFKARRLTTELFKKTAIEIRKNLLGKRRARGLTTRLDLLNKNELEQIYERVIDNLAKNFAEAAESLLSKEAYKQQARNFCSDDAAKYTPAYEKLVCTLLDEEKIFSESDLVFATGWVVYSLKEDLPAGIGIAAEACLAFIELGLPITVPASLQRGR